MWISVWDFVGSLSTDVKHCHTRCPLGLSKHPKRWRFEHAQKPACIRTHRSECVFSAFGHWFIHPKPKHPRWDGQTLMALRQIQHMQATSCRTGSTYSMVKRQAEPWIFQNLPQGVYNLKEWNLGVALHSLYCLFAARLTDRLSLPTA